MVRLANERSSCREQLSQNRSMVSIIDPILICINIGRGFAKGSLAMLKRQPINLDHKSSA
jgi:hypothetical protein